MREMPFMTSEDTDTRPSLSEKEAIFIGVRFSCQVGAGSGIMTRTRGGTGFANMGNMKQEMAHEGSEGRGNDVFVAEEIRVLQPALREYVAALLSGRDGVDDLVQETNLFLWSKRTDFVEGTNFRSWALRVAWFKVMAARRDRAREGKVVFSDSMIEMLAERAEQRMQEADARLGALRICLEKTRPQDRRLLQWKYARGGSLTELAAACGKAPTAIHKSLSRLRLALRHCVENQLKSARP
jgi:RNA polymerase sigma-70 factor (ECF subfamily)